MKHPLPMLYAKDRDSINSLLVDLSLSSQDSITVGLGAARVRRAKITYMQCSSVLSSISILVFLGWATKMSC